MELFRSIFASPRDLILLVAAGWFGLALADKRARQTPIGEKPIDSLMAAMTAAFLLGGRVMYAVEHASAFLDSPASLISLNVAVFDTWAGIATAAVVAAVIVQRKGLPAWQTLDLLSPSLASLGIGLALSHVATGAAFGKETRVPWAINLWGASRYPTQYYELVAAVMILGIVWYYGARKAIPGKTFLLWLALAAASRLVIEGFRGDSSLVLRGLRLAQVVAWVVLALALIGWELRSRAWEQSAPTAPSETTGD